MRSQGLLAGFSALLLSGCVTNQVVWNRPGATSSDFELDKAQCQYQAALGTPPTVTPVYRSMSANIGSSIGAGIADAMREIELMQLCLKAKGYTPSTVQVSADATPQEGGPTSLTPTGY